MRVPMKCILVVTCLLIAAEPSFACLCANRSTSQRKKDSDAVFMGTVIGYEREGRFWRARIAVERSWKGSEAEEITVYSGGGCMAWFEVGQKYLVFAYSDKGSGRLETNVCMGTGHIKYAEKDLVKLGKGKAVGKPNPKPNNGMHPTADTNHFINLQRCGAAGDAGRYAAVWQTGAMLRGRRAAEDVWRPVRAYE